MPKIHVVINDKPITSIVEDRTSLADFLREEIGLTGTRLGCEQGVCGACTVIVAQRPVRSCLFLAAQANGERIQTIEGLAPSSSELSELQEAFRQAHGLQCGFCTSGMLLTAHALLAENPDPDEATIRDWMHGNLCRCTGYQQIVEAVRLAAESKRGEAS
ncbi:MAG: (2Fe-2S)-binding protein [Microbacteriaceae bacterium]